MISEMSILDRYIDRNRDERRRRRLREATNRMGRAEDRLLDGLGIGPEDGPEQYHTGELGEGVSPDGEHEET